MRWLALAAPLLSGCVLGALDDSGHDCPAGQPPENGFRVTVPETVGDGDNLVRTHGYCVAMHATDGDGAAALRSVREGVAWIPVDAPGTYRFWLSIRDPGDAYCAFWMETVAQHDGAGVVEVPLAYDGTSVCA